LTRLPARRTSPYSPTLSVRRDGTFETQSTRSNHDSQRYVGKRTPTNPCRHVTRSHHAGCKSLIVYSHPLIRDSHHRGPVRSVRYTKRRHSVCGMSGKERAFCWHAAPFRIQNAVWYTEWTFRCDGVFTPETQFRIRNGVS
jgi:hypothetical protein